jgi:hypothetical protein
MNSLQHILFDASVDHYLSLEDIVVLGQITTGRLIQQATINQRRWTLRGRRVAKYLWSKNFFGTLCFMLLSWVLISQGFAQEDKLVQVAIDTFKSQFVCPRRPRSNS